MLVLKIKKDPYFEFNLLSCGKKDNFAFKNTFFAKSRTVFKKYPYLGKNKDIIQSTVFLNLTHPTLTTRTSLRCKMIFMGCESLKFRK